MGRDAIATMTSRAGDVLNPEEQYLGAHAMTIKGRNALNIWASGADLEVDLANYIAQHGEIDKLDVADDELPNAFLAAVTSERLLLFSRSMTGKPRDLVDQHDLSSATLDVIDIGARARSRLFVFGMPSGRVFAGESPINGKALDDADLFVDAWRRAQDSLVS